MGLATAFSPLCAFGYDTDHRVAPSIVVDCNLLAFSL